jgi:hypothetical protein
VLGNLSIPILGDPLWIIRAIASVTARCPSDTPEKEIGYRLFAIRNYSAARKRRAVGLSFDRSGRETFDDPILEDHDQDHEGDGYNHRTGHDRSPRLLK